MSPQEKAFCLLVKFLKLRVLNLTKVDPLVAGSIVNSIYIFKTLPISTKHSIDKAQINSKQSGAMVSYSIKDYFGEGENKTLFINFY